MILKYLKLSIMYSDLYLQQKAPFQLPKVFLVGILALSALVSSQLYFWYASVPASASETTVQKFQVANVSESSFGVFFVTEEPVSVYVIYGKSENALDNYAYDVLDDSKYQGPRKYHLFNLAGLDKDTSYWYQLVSDKKLLEYGDMTKFKSTTLASPNFQKSKNPIYGKITTPNGEGASETHLLISRLDKSIATSGTDNVFVVTTKPSGEWLYTLPSTFIDSDLIRIEVYNEKYTPSHIQALVMKSSPIPQTTIVGTDYAFSESDNVLGVDNVKKSPNNSSNDQYIVSIAYPELNAVIPDPKPLFKGYGIPRTKVTLEVNSKPIFRHETIVDAQGVWIVEPKNSFAFGPYILTVKILDTSGTLRSLTRSFIIAKSGEQVLGETTIATPSGTLTPSTSITPTTITPLILSPTSAPIVTIVTSTPFITTVTQAPIRLEEAGMDFPLWLPLIGAAFMAIGYSVTKWMPRSE